MMPIIQRNKRLPAKESSRFTTVHNFQTQIIFHVHETESVLCTEDSYIGSITIDVPKMQAGEPKVMLELSLNEDCAKSYVVGYEDDPKYFSEKVIRII